MRYITFGVVLFLLGGLWACTNQGSGLPVYGNPQLVEKEVNGTKVVDTLEHTIPSFSLINQDGATITEKEVENKIYVVDFFFTSCPTICPKVKKNMKNVYNQYKDNPEFLILSHSIDVKYDTVGRLAWYADKFKISSDTWHLLTGEKEAIYNLSKDYLITALESDDAPGGFDHSGAIALLDRKRRIRGMYDGTNKEEVFELIQDIQLLLDTE